jgi:hypothetical protein
VQDATLRCNVKGNVPSTLDKLTGIKPNLVHGNKGWQDWSFTNLLKQLKNWRDIHPIENTVEKPNQSKSPFKRSPFFVRVLRGRHAQECGLHKSGLSG